MTKTYLIDVTEKIISQGTPGMCFFCPVAIAISIATGRYCRVIGSPHTGYKVASPDVGRLILLPGLVNDWIQNFDQPFGFGSRMRPVEPIQFHLTLPVTVAATPIPA